MKLPFVSYIIKNRCILKIMVPYLLGTDMPKQTASKEVNVSENM